MIICLNIKLRPLISKLTIFIKSNNYFYPSCSTVFYKIIKNQITLIAINIYIFKDTYLLIIFLFNNFIKLAIICLVINLKLEFNT